MICCVMPAAGGSILGAVVVVIAAIYGIEWVLPRIWWIVGSAAVISAQAVAVLVPLMRRARARDAVRLPLWRDTGAPAAQLRAAPGTERPRTERPAIEQHFPVHHHSAGPDRARVSAIPGTAGDAITGGDSK